ncbi:MAG TPA: HAMP domain-containing sensor histidine kinase [Vicinamibacteria bacterium]|nr:HAMP domain-containing sensor histidine kinase [Vicinamibacteria bacterium]
MTIAGFCWAGRASSNVAGWDTFRAMARRATSGARRGKSADLSADNERLRAEIAERRRAEALRDEFLSIAAHELKTPLTSLRGFAQLLMRQLDKEEVPDPMRLRQGLSAIDQQSAKLARLVSQLLDVSRIDAGRLELDRKVADVVGVVEDVVTTARVNTFRHEFTVRAPSGALALVDPLRLEQVVRNLVDNAIRYSPDGGPITIEVEKSREAGVVTIAVGDRGLGVPRKHRGRIFDRFHQAHPERAMGGMGLGLYISRQIVELHGGRIEAEYPVQGGTRMVVTLPTGAPAGKSE